MIDNILKHPPVYEAIKIHHNLTIDGDLSKPEWKAAKWSYPFEEIRGSNSPPEFTPEYHRCRTRVKMLWNDDYLYVAALLEYGLEPEISDLEDDKTVDIVKDIIATYKKRNSPIFHRDSDFEVFIDADSSCHHYKELEINAYNTVWNLMLDKPYLDGGREHSGRVAKDDADPLYYEVYKQKSAVKLIEGEINGNDNDMVVGKNVWAVEMALAYQDVLRFTHKPMRQLQEGDFWRINFSRVEHKGIINWTWAPQYVWDVESKSFVGVVNMHAPEFWAYVHFGSSSISNNKRCEWKDSVWNMRLASIMIYYAQRHHFDIYGNYTSNLSELKVDNEFISQYKVEINVVLDQHQGPQHYSARIFDEKSRKGILITDDRDMQEYSENPSISSTARE